MNRICSFFTLLFSIFPCCSFTAVMAEEIENRPFAIVALSTDGNFYAVKAEIIQDTPNFLNAVNHHFDFSSLEEGTEIKRYADAYTYMGTLGESYSIMNRFLPPSYRMFQPPTTLYDSMIYVSNASPTKIIE